MALPPEKGFLTENRRTIMTSSSKLNCAAVLEDVFFSGLCATPHNCGGGHLLRQLQLLKFLT